MGVLESKKTEPLCVYRSHCSDYLRDTPHQDTTSFKEVLSRDSWKSGENLHSSQTTLPSMTAKVPGIQRKETTKVKTGMVDLGRVSNTGFGAKSHGLMQPRWGLNLGYSSFYLPFMFWDYKCRLLCLTLW